MYKKKIINEKFCNSKCKKNMIYKTIHATIY